MIIPRRHAARYDARVEAKRVLVLVGDVIVFTALTVGVFPLLSQFIPQNLAMIGFSSPILYAWWRGALSSRICLRLCLYVIFLCLLLWACGAGILGREWLYPLTMLGCALLLLQSTWERRRRCRLP